MPTKAKANSQLHVLVQECEDVNTTDGGILAKHLYWKYRVGWYYKMYWYNHTVTNINLFYVEYRRLAGNVVTEYNCEGYHLSIYFHCERL